MPSATQTARLEARISTELHAMLKRAAEIQVKKGLLSQQSGGRFPAAVLPVNV